MKLTVHSGRSWPRRALAATATAALVSGLVLTGTTSAAAAPGCSVDYEMNDWGGGFTATVKITNTGDATNGWTLGFAFTGNQRVTSSWSATWNQNDQQVTATSLDWNGTLATGASTSIGFNATYSGSNRAVETFTLNGVRCGDAGPGDPGPIARVANPYAGATVYVNPDWSQRAATGGGSAIANQPTFVWLDRIAAINGTTGARGLKAHLDTALSQGATLFQAVIYNLPGRDCAALASNGELPADAIGRYQTEYIDPIANILDDPAYANLRIVTVVEIDSLPNLITNVAPRPTQTANCNTMKANGNYQKGIGYALGKLGAIPNVYNYIDIGHHGWLGWDDNFTPLANLVLGEVVNNNGAGPEDVHGFVSNVANYGILDEAFFDANTVVGGRPVRESTTWVDWNRYVDEVSFGQAYGQLFSQRFGRRISILIDTSRNGWGGPARPTTPSTSTDPNTFVNQSRLDRRIHLGNWCNQSGAGIGERPRSAPVTGIDAYVWVKPPGESDGSSQEIPNNEGKGFDRMCDPTYTGNPLNNNNMSGALPDSPLSGHWFQAQFTELLRNAHPPL